MREILKRDIMSGKILPGMKPADAQKVRDEYRIMGNRFASRLSGMRKIVTKETEGKGTKAKEPKWNKNHPVRQQMKDDVLAGMGAGLRADGAIPITDETAWKDAKALRTAYTEMTDDLFKSRLNGMHVLLKEKLKKALEDDKALQQDRLIHPRPEKNFRGEVQWIDSDARTLLEIDVANGVHKEMTPLEMYKSRLQYQEACHLLETFRNHLYQELQTQKWRAQWVNGKKQYTIVQQP